MLISNLSYSYPKRLVLLPGRHEIASGDIIRLTGKNGSGKSTILQVIAGILQGYTGVCSFPNKWVTRYIPTNISNKLLLPWYTVGENIALLVGGNGSRHQAQNLVRSFLGPSCSGLFDQEAYTPSPGESAAIALACAIATSPDAILLDETLSFAATEVAQRMAERLELFLKGGGVVFVAAHHDLPFSRAVREVAMRDPDEAHC